MEFILNLVREQNREVIDEEKNLNKKVFEIERRYVPKFDIDPSQLGTVEYEPTVLLQTFENGITKLRLLTDSLAQFVEDRFGTGDFKDLEKIFKDDIYKIFEQYNVIQSQIRQYIKDNYISEREYSVLSSLFMPVRRDLDNIKAKLEDMNKAYMDIQLAQGVAGGDVRELSIYDKYYNQIDTMSRNIENKVYGIDIPIARGDIGSEARKERVKGLKEKEIVGTIANREKDLEQAKKKIDLLHQRIQSLFINDIQNPLQTFINEESKIKPTATENSIKRFYDTAKVKFEDAVNKAKDKLLYLQSTEDKFKNGVSDIYVDKLMHNIQMAVYAFEDLKRNLNDGDKFVQFGEPFIAKYLEHLDNPIEGKTNEQILRGEGRKRKYKKKSM